MSKEGPEPTPGSSLFRAEALEQRVHQQGPGDVVRFAPRWTSWAFYALVAAFAGALVAASVIDVDRHATGITALQGGRVVVLVPAGVAPEVAPGNPVELGARTTEVVGTGSRVLYPAEVEDSYGVEVSVPSIALVTAAEASGEAPPTARVLVESGPLIVALVPGLGALFGDGDG